MALLVIILIIILMTLLERKGKAYRDEKRIQNFKLRQAMRGLEDKKGTILTKEEISKRMHDKQEEQYRKDLEKQGYSDELITVILPTIMNDGK